MKLLKPSWVNHAENSIFSIDVHPDGSRFATGGQGQDSGKIIIWNMAPVIDKAKELDENAPKVLCQMEHHIACVNVVRWSNNGLFLASGSDDKLIMIWQYAHGGMAYQNIENWKCGFTLRGHSGDVMDLAWSAKDQYLATCSVDNTVIIWNALKFPDILCRINAHAGLVKGVAWDPVGTYFASQSDDKTLKIWRTLDWSLEKSIDEPFKQCAGTTHVLRLNWSPDGQLIISAHAINNGAPTAQSIDRGNKWSTKLDFVGHRKAVTAVRFFPQILKPMEAKNTNSPDFKTHCLFALGSRDRSISIWLTNYSRPLCVIQDLFDNPIMDLSWSKSPKPGLLACSMDGTVAYVEFDYEEIGYPLSKPEVEDFFMKKYNHDVNATVCLKPNNINQQMNQQQNSKKEQTNSFKFIENLDILMAQEEKHKQQVEQITNENSNTQFHNSNSLTMTPSKLQMLTENHKQIERRMPDGRRRITPICVCKPGEYDTPKPFGSEDNFNKVGFEKSIGFGSPNDVKIVSKTATEQSTIIVEKRDEKNEILEVSPVKSVVYSKSVNLNNSSTNNSNSNDITVIQQNIEIATPTVVTKQVKQTEIIPVNTNEKMKPTNTTITNSALNTPNITTKPINSTPSLPPKSVQKAPISTKTPQINTQTPTIPQKPKQPINLNRTQANTPQPMDTNDTVAYKQPQQQPKMTTPKLNNLNDHSTGSPHHGHHNTSQHFLQPLKIDKKSTTKIICDKTMSRSAISVEIHNSISLFDLPSANLTTSSHSNEAELQLNLLRYLVDYKPKWQIYLPKKLCEVACSSQLLVCVCLDSTIHFVKPSNGTQLCCPIQLDSRAAVLKCNTNYCMCLTVTGFLYVWKFETNNKQKESNGYRSNESDLNNLTTVINRQSCQSILKDGVFANALLTDHGIPVIYMSKNRSYFFALQTQCWHLVPQIGNLTGEDSQLLFNSSSLFSDHSKSMKPNGNDDALSNPIMGPLSIIQSKDKSSSLIKTIELINKSTLNDNPLFNQHDFTLTHLESQVNASIGLNSAKEYKFWLMTYARYLSENDYEDKLTDLCSFLLGPLYSISWNDNILNYKKRDLLKEILTIIAQNLKFQRLYSYYKQQLNLVKTNLNGGSSSINKNNILNRLTAPILNEESKIQRNNNLMNKLTNNQKGIRLSSFESVFTNVEKQSDKNESMEIETNENETIKPKETVETKIVEPKETHEVNGTKEAIVTHEQVIIEEPIDKEETKIIEDNTDAKTEETIEVQNKVEIETNELDEKIKTQLPQEALPTTITEILMTLE